jgi:hypothetical protein
MRSVPCRIAAGIPPGSFKSNIVQNSTCIDFTEISKVSATVAEKTFGYIVG